KKKDKKNQIRKTNKENRQGIKRKINRRKGLKRKKLKKENQKRNIPKAAEGTYGARPAPWRTLGIFLYNFLML
ncbi:MAG: hypothetical protein ACLSFC_24605, partial [Enterocloster bolteae]